MDLIRPSHKGFMFGLRRNPDGWNGNVRFILERSSEMKFDFSCVWVRVPEQSSNTLLFGLAMTKAGATLRWLAAAACDWSKALKQDPSFLPPFQSMRVF